MIRQSAPRNRSTLTQLSQQKKRLLKSLSALDRQRKLFAAKANALREELIAVERELGIHRRKVAAWVGVFADAQFDLTPWVIPTRVELATESIGSVDIRVLVAVHFTADLPDPYATPLWVDAAIEAVRYARQLQEQLAILQKNFELVEAESNRFSRLFNVLDLRLMPETTFTMAIIRNVLSARQQDQNTICRIAKRKNQ